MDSRGFLRLECFYHGYNPRKRPFHRALRGFFYFMGFSLLSGTEFFVVPKNVVPRNKEPPAMRVRVDCYTKKLPFRVQ